VADHSQPARRTARVAALVASLGLVAAVFASGSSASTGARRAQQRGGDLTFGLEAENTNYCLSRAQLAISGIQVSAAIYDTLAVPNDKGEAVPYLAKSIEPNADFTQWTIGLREGVTFHNGSPLDAAAVKLNLDNFRGAPGATQAGPLFTIALGTFVSDVQVVDPLTVNVVLTTPVPAFAEWLYANGRFGIMAPEQINSGEACATNMIGTGPFVLDEYAQNEKTVVTANPDYWQKGFPKAQSITFVPVVDAAARVNQLQGGELDMVHTSSGLQVQALQGLSGQVNVLQQKPGVREIRYYVLLARDAPFNEPNAREAFAMALDRKKINELRNAGVYDLANSLMDRDAPGYLKNAGYPKFNLKKAKALVEEVKAAQGGFDIILGTTTDAENSQEAQLLQEQLGKAGINADIAQFDQATLINKALSGDIDVLLWRNLHGGYTTSNDDGTYPWFANASDGFLTNFSGFDNEATQAALDAGRGASDPAAIEQAYTDLNKAMAEGIYLVPVWFVDWVIASQTNVKVTFPKIPDVGGKVLFVYGRIPVHGLSKS
jgi:peptide/nickel transport system substrate-binding protein